MKTLCCISKALFLAVGTTAAFSACGELLKNGDFEQGKLPGADGWTMRPHYRVEQGAGRNGTRGLVIENRDPNAMTGEFCGPLVDVKPGVKYRFSGWVKCKNVEGRAKENGVKAKAMVLVLVFDAEGKGLGEYYSDFKTGTVDDWTRIEGVTPMLPPSAAKLQVNPFLWHNATGCAWFDDISLERNESVPVRGLYSSAYRDLAWDGNVRFSALLGIDTETLPMDTLTADFVYSSGNYAEVRVTAETFTPLLAETTIPVSKLPMGRYPVSFELRRKTDGKLITETSLLFMRTASAPARKVWIDSCNRLIVEGKPFFPLGFYGLTIDEKRISRMDGGPFNCYMPYNYLGTDVFDVAARHGLWIIANLKDFIPSGKVGTPCRKVIETQGEADRGLACRFNALKDYPRLLAWYMNDESSVAHVDRLVRQYRYVRDNDADHPVWAVLYQHDQVREYRGTCDVIGSDNYPIGLRPIETVSAYARDTKDGFLGGPCWHVPQAINWKSYLKSGKTENYRMPTKEEARSMSWQFIANGGNGLVYYTFERLIDEGGSHWEDYCTVARAVKSLEAILLSDPAPNATGYPELMSGRAWTHDGKTYLLIVNENAKPRSADLELSKRFSDVKALKDLPTATRVALNGNRLHVEMEPIGVAMLELIDVINEKGR